MYHSDISTGKNADRYFSSINYLWWMSKILASHSQTVLAPRSLSRKVIAVHISPPKWVYHFKSVHYAIREVTMWIKTWNCYTGEGNWVSCFITVQLEIRPCTSFGRMSRFPDFYSWNYFNRRRTKLIKRYQVKLSNLSWKFLKTSRRN